MGMTMAQTLLSGKRREGAPSATRRLHALVLLTSALIVAGCRARPSAPLETATPSYRADAIVSFHHAVDSETFYALPSPRRFAWSTAAVMQLPMGHTESAGTVRLDSGTPSPRPGDGPVLLVMLQAYSSPSPYGSAHIVPIGPRATVTDRGADPPTGDRPCAGGEWIAAFFIEGFGARPQGPVVLVSTINGVTRRLRVDPAQHTLSLVPALHLSADDAVGLRESRSVSVRSSSTFPMMALLAWREAPAERPGRRTVADAELGPRWNGALGFARGGGLGVLLDPSLRPPTDEWLLYLLDAPPTC